MRDAAAVGPPTAAEVLREALYRGADRVVLLTDRKAAGSDTLATSYVALKCAVEQVGRYDLVFCGRQAIDGDTAQVGPQVAEKLGCRRSPTPEPSSRWAASHRGPAGATTGHRDGVRCRLPCLLTVVGTANLPRPPSARRMIAYKLAATPLETPALLRAVAGVRDRGGAGRVPGERAI